jgi:hypothetical protein
VPRLFGGEGAGAAAALHDRPPEQALGSLLDCATSARDIHTIIGLAACGVGVGLGPSRMRQLRRDDVWFCEVTPRVRLPDLQLSFRAVDLSPVLAAFLDVVRANCQEVGSRLDDVLAKHPAVGAARSTASIASCPPSPDHRERPNALIFQPCPSSVRRNAVLDIGC